MKWQEPIAAAKKRAAFWNRSGRNPWNFSFLCLAIGIPVAGISVLALWARTGPAAILPSSVLGLAGGLAGAAFIYWKTRYPAVCQTISLEDDCYSITGNVSRSGRYSELLGFAFIQEAERSALVLFDPIGHHLCVGLSPSITVKHLRQFLSARMSEIDPHNAPEPRMTRGLIQNACP